MEFNQQNKSRGGDDFSSRSGKEDLQKFHNDLQEKQLTEYNANEVVKTFMEKRGSIETVLGEKFEDFSSMETQLENMKENEKYRESEGFVREVTFEKSESIIQELKQIISWREVQIRTMETLIQKQNELITRQKGKDLSREVLEEMQEVFEQKFDSDKEKLQVLKETINEKMESQKETLRSDISDVKRRQDSMVMEMLETIDVMNQTIEELEKKTDINVDNVDISSDFQEEAQQKDFESDLEVEKPETPTQQPEPNTQQVDQESDPDFLEEDSGNSGLEFDRPEDWSEHVEVECEKIEGGNFTHKVEPSEITAREWQVLRGLDEGCETKNELRDYVDTRAGAFPMQQINGMVRNDQIEKSNLPEKLAEAVKA